jgi:hypothetical protein
MTWYYHRHECGHRSLPWVDSDRLEPQRNKKADMAEHPKVFGHVGLLFNKPPGKAELLFIQSSDQHSLYQ